MPRKPIGPVGDKSVFVPERNVLSVRQGARLALLSISDQAYFTLNESATVIWQSIRVGATVQTTTRVLAAFYGISESEARHDVCAVLALLHAKDLIRPSSAAIHERNVIPQQIRTQRVRREPPTAMECFVSLIRMMALLRLLGAAQLVPNAMHKADSDRFVPDEAARMLTRRMRLAAAWLPWTGTCLPQSLATISLLREWGYRPYLQIGVYPAPFSAHAWVVCGGRPVNETPEQLMRYRVLELDGNERLS